MEADCIAGMGASFSGIAKDEEGCPPIPGVDGEDEAVVESEKDGGRCRGGAAPAGSGME
jgi:hypothetical protein